MKHVVSKSVFKPQALKYFRQIQKTGEELQSVKQKGVIISSISTWEIALLVARERLALTIDVRDWIRKTEGLPFVRFMPVDNTIALRSVSLPGLFHQDPADRIITATAMTMGIPLVTRDNKILSYPHVQTIWKSLPIK